MCVGRHESGEPFTREVLDVLSRVPCGLARAIGIAVGEPSAQRFVRGELQRGESGMREELGQCRRRHGFLDAVLRIDMRWDSKAATLPNVRDASRPCFAQTAGCRRADRPGFADASA